MQARKSRTPQAGPIDGMLQCFEEESKPTQIAFAQAIIDKWATSFCPALGELEGAPERRAA
jgi:hypothetical protein